MRVQTHTQYSRTVALFRCFYHPKTTNTAQNVAKAKWQQQQHLHQSVHSFS